MYTLHQNAALLEMFGFLFLFGGGGGGFFCMVRVTVNVYGPLISFYKLNLTKYILQDIRNIHNNPHFVIL